MRCNILIAALLILCRTATPATAGPIYNIVPLGLDDFEHTRNDGYKYSNIFGMSERGQVSGQSNRYNGGSADLGQSAWLYNGATTIDIGLTGPEHRRNDGLKISYPQQKPNEAGQVIGGSYRYNGGSMILGYSAWLYDGATTIDIGLTDAEHTRNDGYQESYSGRLNAAGQVLGSSTRYNGGSTDLGTSIWLYDGTTTKNIGLTDPEHTYSIGYRKSYVGQPNQAGLINGYSERANGGSTWLGYSAWLYNGDSTIVIGLTGSEYTRNDGYKYSIAGPPNEAGRVIGYSHRYNGGSANLGVTAWLYDGATTIDIGLTGSEHTRNDGENDSYPQGLSESGKVSGYSYRFNGGSTILGKSAWLYDGASTIDIGLTGAEHTRNDGYKESFFDYVNGVDLLNETVQVAGTAYRYNGGSTQLGQSVWLYDGTTTIAIGLTGSEHTQNNGSKRSVTNEMNEAGQVRGYSDRYNGGNTFLGRSAWLYDGATTLDIGLVGSAHTRNDGFKYSSFDLGRIVDQLNEAGQVIGYSHRYNGGSAQLGQDAWLYDSTLDQIFTLQLSMRSDGYASSTATYLGEDGLVLGSYVLFDALDNSLGNRLFYFTIAEGLHDLGSLVDDGLAANGWDFLASAIRANGLGQILGHGKLSFQSGGQMAYLLTPVPPLPGDVNFDGVVNIFDINLLSVHWGGTGPEGDANGDGVVNIFDINLVSANWTPIGGGSAAAVPEPATLVLAICGILGPVYLRGTRR